jgi:hypothetical protein
LRRSSTSVGDDQTVQPYAQRDAARSEEEVVPGPWSFFVSDVIGPPEEVVAGDGQVLARLHHRADGSTSAES